MSLFEPLLAAEISIQQKFRKTYRVPPPSPFYENRKNVNLAAILGTHFHV